MTENQVIKETLRYISDQSYNYAILIDGEWGCGKTFFITNTLKKLIEEKGGKKVKYISLYGCRTVQDIQENLVWSFADDAKEKWKVNHKRRNLLGLIDKEKTGESNTNILLTSKKITNGVFKKFLPETNIYDIASDFISMKSYIFVFDDIERCDCPLTEVFGFINGLVEHEGVKVILVANEKEISIDKQSEQKEMQYMVVLNEGIKWETKDNWHGNTRNNETIVNREVLEERRKELFSEGEVDSTYQKIREKLIGVTLKYQPNISEIIEKIIEKSIINEELKQTLFLHMDFFQGFMNTNNHHNLRTFQFFISKILYLYDEFLKIAIDEKYKSRVLSFIIIDCFRCAIRFKGNIPVPTDLWQKSMYEAEKKSLVIKEYVETGYFKQMEFQNEIEKYIKEELEKTIPQDDPFNLLNNEFYSHPQTWCEEKLNEIKKGLEENQYPVFLYGRIILLVVTLCKIGFSEEYLVDYKKIMLENILNGNASMQIYEDLYFVEDNERREKALDIIKELNNAIAEIDKEQSEKNMEFILKQKNWIDDFKKYVEKEENLQVRENAILSTAKVESWIHAIENAAVEDLEYFRKWIYRTYPENYISNTLRKDIETIRGIAKGIILDKEEDIIKRWNLKWLKDRLDLISKLID